MPIEKRIYCDSCGETFSSEHELSMHHKYTGGNRLPYLDRAFNSAKTLEEKYEAVLDFFDLTKSEPIHRLRFRPNMYACAIKRARGGTIHNEDSEYEYECDDWYKSNFELADFIEENLDTMKAEYNRLVMLKISKAEEEHVRELNVMRNMLK
jgi:hypothetical protein